MQGSVRKRGNTWYYSYEIAKIDGKRKRIERAGGKTKQEALSALRKALIKFENTGQPFTESTISVHDYFDYYFKNYIQVNLRYNTEMAYKYIIENHIKPVLGMYQLKKITPSILQNFVNSRFINGLSRSTLSNIVALLNSAFKYAVYPYQFIKENPMVYINLPRYTESKGEINRTVISKATFKILTERFDESSKFYLMLMIGYHTGMRIGEVIALTWDDIDFEEKTINIDKILYYKKNSVWAVGPPKTFSSIRKIEIGETLLNVLRKAKETQSRNEKEYGGYYVKHYLKANKDLNKPKEYDVVVPLPAYQKTVLRKINFVCLEENGKLVTANSFKYVTKVAHYEMGITFNFHSLRHTHATILIESGANLIDVQARLGHSRIDVTYNYLHKTKKMAKETVKIFEEYVKENPKD